MQIIQKKTVKPCRGKKNQIMKEKDDFFLHSDIIDGEGEQRMGKIFFQILFYLKTITS